MRASAPAGCPRSVQRRGPMMAAATSTSAAVALEATLPSALQKARFDHISTMNEVQSNASSPLHRALYKQKLDSSLTGA